jgi:type VI secretion system secreted protein VgrG
MPAYTQGDRELTISTPLGKDMLLITALRGSEAISELFSFHLELLAELSTKIQFEKVVGQKATVEMCLPTGEKRYFDGIIKRLSQGKRDKDFVHYRAELVPKLWLLTKEVRCRIFQQMTVPDMLNKVLTGLNVSYELSAHYYPRDYCVQYRESDFDFASRLIEEEGIYYFFDHTHDDHQLVVTDDPTQHPPVSGQINVTYDELAGGVRNDLRITSWEKTQELRSGEYTLWDHCFELPGKNLEAKEKTIGSINVGKVTHKLNIGGNDQLEIYDYPGGYAQRFDGMTRSGGEQPKSLNDVFRDKDRTVRIRMEQEEVRSIEIAGAGNCGYFSPGHRFSLERHFDADGTYLLTRVEHEARISGNYRSADALPFTYENHFHCIPLDLPYRPQRVTSKPVMASHQTATVVGPKGEEIFCDKYGRVKVQFHWDREGKKDGDSSCWVRVSQVWAGKLWGAFFWPRIGHEVVVVFEDGDPDQPLIIGSVYNAENMPWFELPANKMLGGFKSASFSGTPGKNYNGMVFNDQQGHEHLSLHSERNLSLNSENDKMIHSGNNKGERVAVANVFTVGNLLPTGGSGGGAWHPWSDGLTLELGSPIGSLGINAQTIYGLNQQNVVGLNNAVTFLENLQIVLDPVSGGLQPNLWPKAFERGPIRRFLSRLGGNTQFTWGNNSQFTYGREFNLSSGTGKFDNDLNEAQQGTARTLVKLLVILEFVYLLAYNIDAIGDDVRSVLTVGMQVIAAALVGGLMAFEQKAAENKDKSTTGVTDEFKAKKNVSLTLTVPNSTTPERPPGVLKVTRRRPD